MWQGSCITEYQREKKLVQTVGKASLTSKMLKFNYNSSLFYTIGARQIRSLVQGQMRQPGQRLLSLHGWGNLYIFEGFGHAWYTLTFGQVSNPLLVFARLFAI